MALQFAMNLLNINSTKRVPHQIILWWEIRRIGYNVILFIAGLLSFYIAFVSIPLIYLAIGIGLNLIYTSGWIIEILFINKSKNEAVKINYPKYFFVSYLVLSILFVFGFAISLILT